MGSLITTISLRSSDVLSTDINLSVSSVVNADSGYISRSKVAATSAASALTVYKQNDKLESAYIYIKNLDEERENFIHVFADTAADDPVVLKLAGGEFAFMPIDRSQTLKAYGTITNQILEYSVFGLDDPANTLS